MCKVSDLKTYKVFVDGGAKGNGTPDAKAYGSFMVTAVGLNGSTKDGEITRFTLPEFRTSNEAEFASMERALGYIYGLVERTLKAMGDNRRAFNIIVYGDSSNTIGAMNGTKKVKAKNLVPIYEATKQKHSLIPVPVKFVKVGREEIVAVLGH